MGLLVKPTTPTKKRTLGLKLAQRKLLTVVRYLHNKLFASINAELGFGSMRGFIENFNDRIQF